MRRLILAALLAAATRAPATERCPGDCDGNGSVTVDELVVGVRIAVEEAPLASCAAFDVSTDELVSIDELVSAVGAALDGCPATPSPSPAGTPSVAPTPAAWSFTDVTAAAGVGYEHRCEPPPDAPPDVKTLRQYAGGVGVGDFDGDDWIDLYGVRGTLGDTLLLRNRGDGTFESVSSDSGAILPAACWSSPTFADVDGNGTLDLFVGGMPSVRPRLLLNRGDGTFDDFTSFAGIEGERSNFSPAFGDYDRDGDLDLALAHWGTELREETPLRFLWRNDGGGRFSGRGAEIGITTFVSGNDRHDYSFTPNFADIDSDGWPDLLMAADFGTSQVFLNQRDGTFRDATDRRVITDRNGMGAAIGDYDRDGDLDWFVTAIEDLGGNRLYRNRGDGTFENATDSAGVRNGHFGWAACFADFNNDGFLDLFHENGWEASDEPAVLFVARGDGTFDERADLLGLRTTAEGRGVACFDYDRDGDLDVFLAHANQPAQLFRNDGGNQLGFLQVKLIGRAPNTEAIGGRVYVVTGAITQMREIRAGSNFASQDPALAHFGLGTSTMVDRLRIIWPDGTVTEIENVAGNQLLTVRQ